MCISGKATVTAPMTAAKPMEGEAATLHQAKACLHYDLEKR